MKKPVSPHTVAFLALGLMAPLSAQNLASNPSPVDSILPGTYEVPATERAQGDLSDEAAVITAQDLITLEVKEDSSRKVDSVIDLGVLRNPSPFRKLRTSAQGQPYQISENSLQTGLALISAVYRESGKSEPTSDCSAIALSVRQQIKLDPSQILELVEREVAANPGCACELVKSAITTSEANTDQVVAIAEVAIHAAPDSMRIISQCAIAAMPDSVAGVQALLAKLDPNAGESASSAKSAKSAKVATIVAPALPNPLDRPPPPLFPPPPIFPPDVTDVNPCGPTS